MTSLKVSIDDPEWLSKMKSVKQSRKDLVFGYIRLEGIRLFSSSEHTEIPPLINFICLWYLHIPETRLSTPNHYNYKHWFEVDPDRNCVEFKVKANNDAHVALGSDQLHNGKHWEIVIGGWANQQSVIRKKNQGAHMDTFYGRGSNRSLDCNLFKVRDNDREL